MMPAQPAVLHHGQHAHVAVTHQLRGFEQGGVGVDREDVAHHDVADVRIVGARAGDGEP